MDNLYKKIKKPLLKICRYSYSLYVHLFTERISKKKFIKNHKKLKKTYINTQKSFNFSKYIMPKWEDNMNEIEKYFLNNLSFSFLNNQIIKKTMFFHSSKDVKSIQKELILKYLGRRKTKEILRELTIGRPLLNDFEYRTSGNTIHLTYHLTKFLKESGERAENLDNIIEVGGGYGNMARIYKKINPKGTYTIIDIPIFSYIQALYLKTIFGSKKVHLNKNTLSIKRGKINIVPLNEDTIGKINNKAGKIDLFISTWALSESNEFMQKTIKDLDYFKSRYLLLAYQKNNSDFYFAEDINNIKKTYKNIYSKETSYLKNNYYLFCKRI